jgi:LysM repeat protein
MDINTITLDQPAGPKASNAPRGGDGSFQAAYAKVLGENYALVAREGAPAHPPRGQDSPPPDRAAHTVRAGETLYGIVRSRLAMMGVDANAKSVMQGVKQLAQTNNVRNPDRIYVGQKLDVTGLESSFGRQTAPLASGVDRFATAASGIEQPQQWHWEEPALQARPHLEAEELAALPLTIDALPPTLVRDDAAAGSGTPLAARQVALYEQNASIAVEKPDEPARALPDIVYKGVVGKVLDAMPLDPSTRTELQRANTVVGSAFTARSLGVLMGLGGPLLTVAGLIWGIFSARHIDATATGETKPAGEPKPAGDAMQTAQNKAPEALN